MNHNEAVATQATEKYLLGELPADERDQFEDHLFDCGDCALDLRAATIFLEQSKAVLRAPEPSRERTSAPNWGWMQWLRPAISIPVMATLIAIIGYQATRTAGDSITSPQLIRSLSLITANSRGSVAPAAILPAGKPVIIFVDIPPAAEATSYAADLRNPGDALLWTLPISTDTAKDTLTLEIPAVQGPAGTYSLVIRALDGKGQSSEVARYPLALERR